MGGQERVDLLEPIQDLAVVEQMELEPVRKSLARLGRRHGVQIEVGGGVVPGLGKAQRHDHDPRLLGQGHISADRLAPLEDRFRRRRRHQRVQVRIEPAVLAHPDEVAHLELLFAEAPPQLVGDGGDHIAVHQGVGIGLEAGVERDIEFRGGDLVALGDQLFFDVAREAGADGEDQFRPVDMEARPEFRLGQGHQPFGLSLGRPRPAGILMPDALERV